MIQRLLLALMCFLLMGWGTQAQTTVVGKTPQNRADYAQGVSGHAATLLEHGKKHSLLMLGGCNFPNRPAVEGGEKRYYAEVYSTRYRFEKPIGAWTLVGKLPEPLAYAAYQKYNNQLIVAGGKNSKHELRRVYRLSLTAQGQLRIDTLPSLPEPRSSMASALIGSRLYLIGGSVAGKLSNTMISLDLDKPQEGWQEEASYPNSPYLKVLAAGLDGADGQRIHVFASFTNTDSDTDSVATEARIMDYKPETKSWEEGRSCIFEGYTFGGGSVYANAKEQNITLIGGVSEKRFLPALRREQELRVARQRGDEETVARLTAEGRDYLSQSREWYNFCPTLLFVNYSNHFGGTSMSVDPSAHLAKADAALVEITSGYWLLLGGEIKPGVRTADIVY